METLGGGGGQQSVSPLVVLSLGTSWRPRSCSELKAELDENLSSCLLGRTSAVSTVPCA